MKKKFLIFLILITIMMTGCVNEKEYISTVKKMTFENGVSVEDIVNDKLLGIDLAVTNYGGVDLLHGYFLFFSKTGDAIGIDGHFKEIANKAWAAEYKAIYEERDYKWEIEGKTTVGKIIIATSEYGRVEIKTTDDGDYVKVSDDGIKQIKYDDYYISDDTIDLNIIVNNCIVQTNKEAEDEYAEEEAKYWESKEQERQ